MKKYPFWVEVGMCPVVYMIAILKIIVFIPDYIIAKINTYTRDHLN
jgi:hypothetical protein